MLCFVLHFLMAAAAVAKAIAAVCDDATDLRGFLLKESGTDYDSA